MFCQAFIYHCVYVNKNFGSNMNYYLSSMGIHWFLPVVLNLDLSWVFVFLSFIVESPFLELPYQPHWRVIKSYSLWLMAITLSKKLFSFSHLPHFWSCMLINSKFRPIASAFNLKLYLKKCLSHTLSKNSRCFFYRVQLLNWLLQLRACCFFYHNLGIFPFNFFMASLYIV